MGRKCSVYSCKSGYKSNKSDKPISFYKFPTDPELRQKWIRALPNKLDINQVTENMCVCSEHFPADVATRTKRKIPIDPPSIFKDLKEQSCSGTPQPKSRSTTRTTFEVRTRPSHPDAQLHQFNEDQKLKMNTFKVMLGEIISLYSCFLVWHPTDSTKFSVISVGRNGPVFDFSLHFHMKTVVNECITDLGYEAYVGLKRIFPKCLPSRSSLNVWHQVEILFQYAAGSTTDFLTPTEEKTERKFDFISRQVTLLNTAKNLLIYNSSDILHAFSWYTFSRPLYQMLRDDLVLPSITTLRKITRVAKNIQDKTLFSKILERQDERSRGVLLLFDEVYVKATLSYSGEFLVYSNLGKIHFVSMLESIIE